MTSPRLSITPNIELDPWDDLKPLRTKCPHNLGGLSASMTRIGLMPNGTASGRPTVMLEVVLPNGERVIAETTLRLFRMASAALLASPVAQMEDL